MTHDTIDDAADEDYTLREIIPEWNPDVIEEDERIIKQNSHALRVISRDGASSSVHQLTGVSFRDSVNSAFNPSFTIPPDDTIKENMETYLSGRVDFYINEDVAFSGDILKVSVSEKDGDDIKIKARNPGRRLSDETVDFTPDNRVVQDIIAKTVDRYNDYDAEHRDMRDTGDEAFANTWTIDDFVFVDNADGGGGWAEYANVGDSVQDLSRLYAKIYSGGVDNHVTVEISPHNSDTSYLQGFTNEHSLYGEWVEVNPDVDVDGPYDIRFHLFGNAFLADWIALTSDDVKRETTPPEINVRQTEEFLYSRHSRDDNLEVNVIEEETDETIVWDDADEYFRTRQVAAWQVWDGGTSQTSDADATAGQALNMEEGIFTPKFTVRTDDTIPQWEMWARVKRVAGGSEQTWDVSIEVDDDVLNYSTYAPIAAYEWRRLAVYDYESVWPDNLEESMTVRMETQSNSNVGVHCCSCVFIIGDQVEWQPNYNFDNTLHSSSGHLNSPHEYAGGKVTFEPFNSEDNISKAWLLGNIEHSGNILDDWGATHRIRSSGDFPPPENSTEMVTDFPYPGVQHQAQFKLEPGGLLREGTPREGYELMAVTGFDVDVSTNDLEIVYNQDFTGNRLESISRIADDSTVLFRWDGNVCRIFQRGSMKTDNLLRGSEITTSVGIEEVYSSVEVIGLNGVTSGVIEAEATPDYIDRHKEIRDVSIETTEDAQRRAIAFLNNNAEVSYEGTISTLPTVAPIGEDVDGSYFPHGNDMVIEEASYGLNGTKLSLGFIRDIERRLRGTERKGIAVVQRETSS